MLKNVSPPPAEARDEQDEDSGNPERRMRLALEALSGPGARQTGASPEPRTDGMFRQDRGFDRSQVTRRDLRDNQGTHAAKARHRFVKDGEVPVVHLAAPRPRDAMAAETDTARLKEIIEDHRLRLEQAERAGRDLQAQLRTLQTKCAHTEMALNDATALAESRLHEIEALQERQRVDVDLRPLPALPDQPLPRRRGRPPGSTNRVAPPSPIVTAEPTAEPEPIEWWLQPAKASIKGARRF